MKPITSTLTTKGQTTIPKPIRELLQLQPGDRIDFVIDGDRVYLQPTNLDIRQLSGILHTLGRPSVSLETMDAVIAAGAARQVDTTGQ